MIISEDSNELFVSRGRENEKGASLASFSSINKYQVAKALVTLRCKIDQFYTVV